MTASGDAGGRQQATDESQRAGARCFGDGDPLYEAYHDDEWGHPVTDERGLFERVSLEAFQSGLSWLTILRKRDAFRAAFADFEPDAVARFGSDDVERLLGDAGIVRNRAKIEATIANARATVDLRDAGTPLDELVWSHRPAARPAPASFADVPAQVPEAAALAKALKRAGFRFVGPTTIYAGMQACGLVNDHLATCPVRERFEAPSGRRSRADQRRIFSLQIARFFGVRGRAVESKAAERRTRTIRPMCEGPSQRRMCPCSTTTSSAPSPGRASRTASAPVRASPAVASTPPR